MNHLKNTPVRLLLVAGAITLLAACPTPFKSGDLSILRDEHGPQVTIASPSSGSFYASTVTVSGTMVDRDDSGDLRAFSDPAAIPEARYEVLRQDLSADAAVAADGSFSFTLNTTSFDQDLEVAVSSTDANGNVTTETIELLKDDRGPAISITSPTDGNSYLSSISLAGNVTDTADANTAGEVSRLGYEILGEGISEEITFDPETGAFSESVSLSGITRSPLTIRLSATDLHGDRSQTEIQMTNDGVGPAITLDSPDDFSYYATVVELSGSVANTGSDTSLSEVASLEYRIQGSTISGTLDYSQPGSEGQFATTINVSSLSDNVVLEVRGVDLNGNQTIASVNLLKDSGGSDIPSFSASSANRSAVLTWDGVPGALSYTILNPRIGEQRTVSGTEQSDGSHRYVWDGLDNTRLYTFQLAADVDGSLGSDAVSSRLDAVPLSEVTLAPTINATPSGGVGIAWAPAISETEYLVERATSASGPWSTVTITDGSRHLDTGLSGATRYYYRVSPFDYDGEPSASANGLPGFYGTIDEIDSLEPASGSVGTVALAGSSLFVGISDEISQVDLSDPDNPYFLSGVQLDGSVRAIEWTGSHLVAVTSDFSGDVTHFEAFGTKPLQRLDLAFSKGFQNIELTPDTTSSSSSPYLQNDVTDIAVGGDYALVSGQSSGVDIIALNGLASGSGFPALVNTYNSYEAWGVEAYNDDGTWVFWVADGDAGLRRVDVGSGGSYTFSTYSLPSHEEARDIAIVGDYAFVGIVDTAGTYGAFDGDDDTYLVRVFDIDDTGIGTEVTNGSLPIILGEEFRSITAAVTEESGDNGYIYVGTSDDGVIVYVADDPTTTDTMDPIRITNINKSTGFSSYPRRVALRGDNLYVANGDALRTLSAAMPGVTSQLGRAPDDTTEGVTSSVVSGSNVYFAEGSNGVGISSLADPENPGIPTYYDPISVSDDVDDLTVIDDRLYFVVGTELHIVDVSDPTAPTGFDLGDTGFASPYEIGANAQSLLVRGDYAYVGVGSEVRIINIADLSDLETIATFTVNDTVEDLAIFEDYLYVADGSAGVVDVSNPASPGALSSVNGDSNVTSLLVDGAYLYTGSGTDSDGSGLRIHTLATPGSPTSVEVIGDAEIGRVYEMVVTSDYLIVGAKTNSGTTPTGGFRIYDVSDKSNATLVGGRRFTSVQYLSVSGNYAYGSTTRFGAPSELNAYRLW